MGSLHPGAGSLPVLPPPGRAAHRSPIAAPSRCRMASTPVGQERAAMVLLVYLLVLVLLVLVLVLILGGSDLPGGPDLRWF